MVKVDVVSVGMDKKVNAYVALLQVRPGERTLPIFIGAFEAGAISMAIEQIRSPRPLVHDLLRSMIEGLGGRVERVEILGMEADYYLACVELVTREGRHVRVDARPSDAVALALRSSAPIFIADEVMAHSGVFLKQEDQAAETAGPGDQASLPSLKEVDRQETDRLNARLRWLVREEAYEAAAEVRDRIGGVAQIEPEEKSHKKHVDMS